MNVASASNGRVFNRLAFRGHGILPWVRIAEGMRLFGILTTVRKTNARLQPNFPFVQET